MNLWHEISPGTADEMNVIVEIPKFSKNKYEIDKDTGLIKLDRPLHTAQDYPFDYGFVPQTYWDDDDPLDVVLLTTYPLMPGILVEARPVGIMEMIDDGDPDHKIIAVPSADPRFAHIHDLSDVNPHTLREMEHFFATYKKLQDKVVEVRGFEGAAEARSAFARAVARYHDVFGSQTTTQ